MERAFFFKHLLLFASLSLLPFTTTSSASDDRRPYIIHMDVSSMPAPFSTHESWYTSILSSLPGPAPTHLYTYTHVLHGFSAVLSSSQLQLLDQMSGHHASYPDTYGNLHTTHTPKFLGLNASTGLWPASNFGDDMVIGILDTGIWPESESFDDKGMPPVPEQWKGKCETGTAFTAELCNRKLVGARSFSKGLKQLGLNISTTDDYDSPRDFMGHGSHTSSTAAGSPVDRASYFGYAEGLMTGIAPRARIAMYKVLFSTDTYDSAATDVLAGMDQAIEDGVDLMSLSLGFFKTPYYIDWIAIGAFAALEKGIFVSVSAGNAGPHAYTVVNGAPWITSVGAGTIDRDYKANITLGNGARIQGRTLFPENIFVSNVTLYYGNGNASKESCDDFSLSPEEVAGKILFCLSDLPMDEVNRTGAKGAIFATNSTDYLNPKDFFVPAVAVSWADGETIKKYITEAPAPAVDIAFIVTELGSKPAPQVVWFSSRGPARFSPGILKPDVLAPGVNVLAAWVPNRAFAPIGDHYLVTDYALGSGTSMASPHVVGIAAMLQSVHKDWSPAAIRSAMMTTADVCDNSGGRIIDTIAASAATPLDVGAGHVNPNKAMDPGLVYDIGVEDYLDFICGLNYTKQQMAVITRRTNYSCTNVNLDLNYPSFAVILETNASTAVFKRVLTSVDDHSTSYRAVADTPKGMKVAVKPQVLAFEGKGSKREFTVEVEIDLNEKDTLDGDYIGNYGYLSWHEIGGKHVVKSPIVSAFAP